MPDRNSMKCWLDLTASWDPYFKLDFTDVVAQPLFVMLIINERSLLISMGKALRFKSGFHSIDLFSSQVYSS